MMQKESTNIWQPAAGHAVASLVWFMSMSFSLLLSSAGVELGFEISNGRYATRASRAARRAAKAGWWQATAMSSSCC